MLVTALYVSRRAACSDASTGSDASTDGDAVLSAGRRPRIATHAPIIIRASPHEQTMAAPVGRSALYEAQRPTRLAAVATTQPMMSRSIHRLASVTPQTAGTMRY